MASAQQPPPQQSKPSPQNSFLNNFQQIPNGYQTSTFTTTTPMVGTLHQISRTL
ncbi:hypothetical protein DICPUDRAFT_148771 [Dictyostelium purpureum]|uniref:Uncharacterized protein n=1 Tax=Dictyostelium purpureum TaxID=5786 RepID=F0ZBY8_DICPU|nr:uncharacterized protein DICPUDRAFT_148771 [Dictyostelium purpureum]EGC38568.1 hypothetical protein DICPUDRAFT_148771 [Dictyostelium purpureum]|eukprot:XP_003284939.1 hypothetical protein DICPUDRAFT_148771 [Dictyostelium purpureum]